jgi:acetyl esterase
VVPRRVSLPVADAELERFNAATVIGEGPTTLEAVVASRAARPDPTLAGIPERVDVRADLAIPLTGRAVRIRLYRDILSGPGPILLWLHGGAFVGGSLDDVDVICAGLARRARIIVISLDYRLAAENPYPAALHDTVEIITWLRAHGAAFGGDGRLAAGGQSSGANLVAAACIVARDEGRVPVDRQILCYPWLDLTSHAAIGTEDPDAWYVAQYLGDMAPSEYAAPLLAVDLSGVPPALVLAAGRDPLRDDAHHYARRLGEAGVEVTLIEYAEAPHAFIQFPAALSLARLAIDDIAADLDGFFDNLFSEASSRVD